MSFTHTDFYHSPSTLQRVATHLKNEGYICEDERKRLSDCVAASDVGGVNATAAENLKNLRFARETGPGNMHKMIQRKAREVTEALGTYVSATSQKEKKNAIDTIIAFLKNGGRGEQKSPKSRNAQSRSFRGSGGEGKVIVFSELSESEKESYMTFLVEQQVQFFKDSDGMYVATVRLEPAAAGGDDADANGDATKRASAARLAGNKSVQLYGRRASRPPAEMARIVGAIAGSSNFDFTAYPKFSSLITLLEKKKLKPRKRPLSWLMRLIEEIYDSRFIHDSADFKDDGTVVEKGERLSNLFPVFVVDFFSKRYGLRNLVDQTCWDLLFNVHMLRKEHLEVEIFARFLEEFYDPDDLLFFLYVRSVIQKEIGINFRNRWNELGRGRERLRETVWLSYRSCVQVSRVVFVSESDPLFRAFMDMIERHLVGVVTRKSDTRRIEVMQFLHLALAEYHETRPAEGEEAAAAQVVRAEQQAGENSLGVGGQILVHSKEEQDRLFKEAEEQYEASIMRAPGHGPAPAAAPNTGETDAQRQQRIRDMEDRIRKEIAHNRSQTGNVDPASIPLTMSSGSSTEAQAQRQALERAMQAQAKVQEASSAAKAAGANVTDSSRVASYLQTIQQDTKMIEEMEKQLAKTQQTPGGALPPPPPNGDNARKELLIEMSKRMHVATNGYLDQLMVSCEEKQLPPEIVDEIRREVQLQLEAKVEQMLEAVVDASYAGDGDMTDPLVMAFKKVIDQRSSQTRTREIAAFCNSVLQSPTLREEIEPLVALLTTFALSNLKKKEGGN